MKHQTVYVPVSNPPTPIPTPNGADVFICVKGEEKIILTDSELLELKKKWCGEAWDDGKRSVGANKTLIVGENGRNGVRVNSDQIRKDKETYLNNINLD